MAKIDIKDIIEQDSELFIEDLGKVRGGSAQGEITTLAMGEEDPTWSLPSPSIPQVPKTEQLISEIMSLIPEYKGMPSDPTTLAAFGEE